MGEVVRLSLDRFEEVYDLYRYAFHKEPRGGKVALAQFYEHMESYGEETDGRLSSQVTRLPFVVNWYGRLLAAHGIGNVSSYPEYRGDGAATRIMRHVIQQSYLAGDVLSYLAPFSFGYYARFGYAQVFDHTVISWASRDFPQARSTTGTMHRLSFADALPELMMLQQQASQFARGNVVRDKWWWQYYYQTKTPGTMVAVYRDVNERATGYVLYEFESTTLIIREWVALNAEALAATTRFIGSHAGSFANIVYEAPTGDLADVPVMAMMVEPQLASVEQRPYMQARIVNLEKFIATLPAREQGVALEVHDTVIAENNGLFEWIDTALVRVTESKLPVVEGDIATMTQWLTGYRTLAQQQLVGALAVTGSVRDLIDQSRPLLADYF